MKTIFADPKVTVQSRPVALMADRESYLTANLDLMKACAEAFGRLWASSTSLPTTLMVDVLPVRWTAGKGEIIVAYVDEVVRERLGGRLEVRPAVAEFAPSEGQLRFEAVLSLLVSTISSRRLQRFALPLDADLLALVPEAVAPTPAPPPAPRAPARRAPRSASAPIPTPLR